MSGVWHRFNRRDVFASRWDFLWWCLATFTRSDWKETDVYNHILFVQCPTFVCSSTISWRPTFICYSCWILLDVDNVLQRMTIIGVLLCFRGLAQEALYDVSYIAISALVKGLKAARYSAQNERKTYTNTREQPIFFNSEKQWLFAVQKNDENFLHRFWMTESPSCWAPWKTSTSTCLLVRIPWYVKSSFFGLEKGKKLKEDSSPVKSQRQRVRTEICVVERYKSNSFAAIWTPALVRLLFPPTNATLPGHQPSKDQSRPPRCSIPSHWHATSTHLLARHSAATQEANNLAFVAKYLVET